VLSSPMRHQLLLGVKEACNNVACHSGATEVWLRLAVREHTLVISVEDDGHGFDPATASEHGNGLNNLRARMANVGGTAEISSVAGERTCVRLVVLLPGE